MNSTSEKQHIEIILEKCPGTIYGQMHQLFARTKYGDFDYTKRIIIIRSFYMLNLMFIRHAETELNKEGIFAGRTDCNITKEGFEQAKEVFLVALYRAGQYTPPGAETTSQVDKRVCSFVEDLFNTYKNNERILIVTHNGVMRSVKRNFVKSYEDIMSKNLGQIVLTDEDYKYYLERIKDKETAR